MSIHPPNKNEDINIQHRRSSLSKFVDVILAMILKEDNV
jgi:hypothetical protein